MFNSFKAFIGLLSLATNLATVAADLDFTSTNAQWIWVPGRAADGITYPPGNVSLRRDYYPPDGKTPLSAEILITADNAYTLWVNGEEIGAQANFHQAFRYCVPLESGCNVFAVEGQNAPSDGPSNVGNAAGVISAIEIRYTDGFTETVVTDAEWHAISGSVSGFEQVAFDDSAWVAAFVEGSINTTAPWNTIGVSIPPATDDPGPNLTSASWIWTNKVVAGSAPVGGSAFLKAFSLPGGQLADSIVIDIVTDNEYTLYINGLVAGSGTDYSTPQRFEVNFVPSNTVTIAVWGVNTGGPAGLLAAAEIRGCACGCGTNAFVVTDATWNFNTTAPADFINPGFDDSKWAAAVVEGPYGMSPWGNVPIPTNNSPQSNPISGAPTAPPATVVS
ncbi:carbohydrate-binding module family 67 protein [Hypholoma sublateritium FD-334 SS-4]|uniref:Carbohydrate-binding module family 67 protein n=1 Tax=Hypholoma sublateritium (strain FD-334 SS-4) TaxID=945553 RepID=A0A0D2M3I6_HYPSF|nr:carbohydrate-binding module family 67 protein [Hypholoma sublateritium FD-334 SS-4]